MSKLSNIFIGLEETEQCDICKSVDSEYEIFYEKDGSVKYICRTCKLRISNQDFREFDFVNFLADLLNDSNEFKNLAREPLIGDNKRLRPDIVGEQITDSKSVRFILEAKSYTAFTNRRLESVIEQLLKYKQAQKSTEKIIFAFPGVLTEEDYHKFENRGIEVWDQQFISRKFNDQIEKLKHPIFSNLFKLPYNYSDQEHLIQQIKDTKKGNSEWSRYQKLIGKTLDLLFGNTLAKPIIESSDGFKVNRRDFVIPNYNENGFWYYMREKYLADFLVIDAKNYSKLVGKKEVLQIANYLKEKGVGLFGLIISRNGGDKGAELTCRETWIMSNKLVIILSDEDIFKMLKTKEPEEILKQKIEDFRLMI